MDTSETKDAFDRWWEWANKPVGSRLYIPADIHNVVMSLPEEQRKDREFVNEAVRAGLSPLRDHSNERHEAVSAPDHRETLNRVR